MKEYHFKQSNICIVGAAKGEGREVMEQISKQIMAENVPNAIKSVNPQIQETQQTPKQIKHEENYIKFHHNQIAKETIDKQKVLKQPEKKIKTLHRVKGGDFSSETM